MFQDNLGKALSECETVLVFCSKTSRSWHWWQVELPDLQSSSQITLIKIPTFQFFYRPDALPCCPTNNVKVNQIGNVIKYSTTCNSGL